MNPIYKFTLAANGGTEQQAFPIYRDDLSKDFELQSNQEFFRAKLSGKLTFVAADYSFIANKPFDTQFDLKIYISYNNGTTWTEYWHGQFWKTNCTFDDDNKSVTLTPDVVDQYTNILAGLEKEFNLIDLAPEIEPVMLDKRPLIQIYVPGQSVIGCFLSGMWWEQECKSVSDYNTLVSTYYFSLNKVWRQIDITQSGEPTLPDFFSGEYQPYYNGYEYSREGYKFKYTFQQSGFSVIMDYQIIRESDSVTLWSYQYTGSIPTVYPVAVTLQPVSGTGATGTVDADIHDIPVYARLITDSETIAGVNTYTIPDNDIVENNRNYSRVLGYYFPDTIAFNAYKSETPTKWGLYEPGQYYDTPSSWFVSEWFPVARLAWGYLSIWFAFSSIDWLVEESGRKQYSLRDAYPLSSVISVLLAQIAPELTHAGTTAYSQFLYGENPLNGIEQTIFITPKSNVISLGYDQPAQKAPITLKRVLDMLRDCFRCYWFIDDNNRFRIEHIKYFMNGGAYSGTPVIGRDLTEETVPRNGKEWAFGTSQYQFDKPEMAARYQFGWMDDVTQLFEGNPLDIVSRYVNPENIEQIDISQFTSDIDYIILNPGEISKEGFVLLAAKNNNYIVPDASPIGLRADKPYIKVVNSWPRGSEVKIQFKARTLAGTIDVAFLDADNNVISTIYTVPAHTSSEIITVTATIPANAAKLQFLATRASTLQLLFIIDSTDDGIYYKLPYYDFELNGTHHILQNAWAAFIYLQQYYFYDMPAWRFKYNDSETYANGIKKLKTQTLKFPALTDPNTLQLIKTNLGNGTIQKMSVNLSSRTANTTLKYDTE